MQDLMYLHYSKTYVYLNQEFNQRPVNVLALPAVIVESISPSTMFPHMKTSLSGTDLYL